MYRVEKPLAEKPYSKLTLGALTVLKRGTLMMKSFSTLLATATLALGTAVAAPAASQGIGDETLKKYVASAQQVAVISQEYANRLSSTEGESNQQSLLQEANDKMVEAVQANGLSVTEFNGISDAIEQDAALRERAQSLAQ